MEFVEPDDGTPFRRPPDLDDRIWRHPSEIGAVEARGKLVPRRTLWMVAAVAAIGASVLSTTMVVSLGALSRATTRATAVTTVPGLPATTTEPVVSIAERVKPAIVQVRAQQAGGRGSGSGVLFRSDNFVLTNAHVVEGANSVTVVQTSGRELAATVVGSDPITDIAVLKVEGGRLPVAELGTAAHLKVGQMAVAIGSPLALTGGPSVTVGVVSALHRSVRTRSGSSQLHDMIQTDAPIAPGSSGGALLDGNGKVIGITTAMAVSDAGAEGLGFAIPIDVARSVGEELISTGRATHSWIGIEGNDLDGATARDLDVDGGARILSVRDESPAAAAGLAARDVILSLAGRPVSSMGALVVALRSHRPGAAVSVEVVRDGERLMKTVTLAERPTS